MSGNRLDAFPEQLPRGIGHGKIRVTLAVEQGVMAGDLQADRADNLSIGGFNHLKFGQPLFQFTRREAHGIPKRFQALKIIRGGAADAEIGPVSLQQEPMEEPGFPRCRSQQGCKRQPVAFSQTCAILSRMKSNLNYE
jgi:hypothetical protein